MRRLLALAVTCLALAACSTDKRLDATAMDHPEKEGVPGAVESPLEDVNILQDEIPPVLIRSIGAPYARPSPPTCKTIAEEVFDLDDALGDDFDINDTPEESAKAHEGRVAGEAAVLTMRDTINDFIPLRSWVRRLSGAKRHADEVRLAVYSGRVRRAYLKGLGEAIGCKWPAAPKGASPLPVRPDLMKPVQNRQPRSR